MKETTYHLFSGTVFLIAAIVHGLRLIMSWDAMIGGWEVPMWISGMAVIVAGYLAYTSLSTGLKKKS